MCELQVDCLKLCGLPVHCFKLETIVSLWINRRVSQTADKWICVDYQQTASKLKQLSLCGLPGECLKLETTVSLWITGRVPQT